MLSEVCISSLAKINIGLKVLPKRDDGFHNIESIFQTVDIADELKVSLSDGNARCKVSCDSLRLPTENTITMAYNAFCTVTGMELPSVNVELTKRIPSGGGLGGGSSNAAALVRALQIITDITLSSEQLDKIAARVGSDVYFFLHCDEQGKGCALVSGRGEYVVPIQKRNDLFYILVFPNVHSSTKEAYELVDNWNNGDCTAFPMLSELESVYRSPVKNWNFYNSFTKLTFHTQLKITFNLR
jgi:4-diphosphocytidyl-2-C-methyl-D-erythritol kinase